MAVHFVFHTAFPRRLHRQLVHQYPAHVHGGGSGGSSVHDTLHPRRAARATALLEHELSHRASFIPGGSVPCAPPAERRDRLSAARADLRCDRRQYRDYESHFPAAHRSVVQPFPGRLKAAMTELIKVPKGEELADGAMLAVSALGRHIIVYRVGGAYFATDRRCTHQSADLMRGYFDQDIIECPVHQGRFNVCTGGALSAPASMPLRTYSVKIIDGVMFVEG